MSAFPRPSAAAPGHWRPRKVARRRTLNLTVLVGVWLSIEMRLRRQKHNPAPQTCLGIGNRSKKHCPPAPLVPAGFPSIWAPKFNPRARLLNFCMAFNFCIAEISLRSAAAQAPPTKQCSQSMWWRLAVGCPFRPLPGGCRGRVARDFGY